MYLHNSINEYGTPVSHHTCDTCGQDFTICPADKNWSNCLAENCASYDPHLDLDILYMTDQEIAAEKKVISIQRLRERKQK